MVYASTPKMPALTLSRVHMLVALAAVGAGLSDHTRQGQLLCKHLPDASIYQMSWMSAATVQAMFHKFCEHLAKEMYDEHIYLPTEEIDELDHVMRQYDRLGFTGAMGSMDVTHIGWTGAGAPITKPVRTRAKREFPRSGTRSRLITLAARWP